jgi:hypothetical protein
LVDRVDHLPQTPSLATIEMKFQSRKFGEVFFILFVRMSFRSLDHALGDDVGEVRV